MMMNCKAAAAAADQPKTVDSGTTTGVLVQGDSVVVAADGGDDIDDDDASSARRPAAVSVVSVPTLSKAADGHPTPPRTGPTVRSTAEDLENDFSTSPSNSPSPDRPLFSTARTSTTPSQPGGTTTTTTTTTMSPTDLSIAPSPSYVGSASSTSPAGSTIITTPNSGTAERRTIHSPSASSSSAEAAAAAAAVVAAATATTTTTPSSSSSLMQLPPRQDSQDDGSVGSWKTSRRRQQQQQQQMQMPPPPPVHNFFQQAQYSPYDSDGSDGSLVFSPHSTTTPLVVPTTATAATTATVEDRSKKKKTSGSSNVLPPPAPPPPLGGGGGGGGGSGSGSSSKRKDGPPPITAALSTSSTSSFGGGSTGAAAVAAAARDRLSSCDSMASQQSTGSIMYVNSRSPAEGRAGVSGKSSSTTAPTSSTTASASAAAAASGSSSPAPPPPRVLPYHERRKLMQRKQERESQQGPNLALQQQQQQQQQQQHAMMMMQQAQYQQQQQLQMQQQAAAQAAYYEQMQARQQQQSQEDEHVNVPNQQHQQLPLPPPPSSNPAQMYPFDPRMAAAYYQMYGMPPPFPPPGYFPPPSPRPPQSPFRSHHTTSSSSSSGLEQQLQQQQQQLQQHLASPGYPFPPPQILPQQLPPPPHQQQLEGPNLATPTYPPQFPPPPTMMPPPYMLSPEQLRQMLQAHQQQQQHQHQQQQQAFHQQQHEHHISSGSSGGGVSGQGLPPYMFPQGYPQHAPQDSSAGPPGVATYSIPPAIHHPQQQQQKQQQETQRHRHVRSNSSNIPLPDVLLQAPPPPRPATASQTQPPLLTSPNVTPIITNIKNPNKAPPSVQPNLAGRPGSFSSVGSSNSVLPPPPPQSPPVHARSNSGSVHLRSDSVASMASLGSSGGFDSRTSTNRALRDSLYSTGSNDSSGDDGNLEADDTREQKQVQEQQQQQQRTRPQQPKPRRDSKGSTASLSFETPPSPLQRKSASSVVTADSHATSASTPETLRETVSHTRQNSFLNLLRQGWSPQSRATERKQPNVDDFHRRNQHFLRSKQRPAATSPTLHKRLGSLDRPPASWGTHRRLSSIPQASEGWNEGEDVDSNSGSDADKKPRATASKSGSGVNLKKAPPPPPPLPPPPGADSGSSRSLDPNPSFETNESTSTPDQEYRYTDDEEEETPNDYGYGPARPDGYYDDDHDDDDDANEETSLLPAAGISTNESDERGTRNGKRSHATYTSTSGGDGGGGGGRRTHLRVRYEPSPRSDWSSDSSRAVSPNDAAISTDRWDNRTAQIMSEAAQKTKKSRKKKYRLRSMQRANVPSDLDDEDDSDEDEAEMDYRAWTMKRASMLGKERSKMIEQWKAEARAEAELLRKEEEEKRPLRRCWTSMARYFKNLGKKTFRCLTLIEVFIANLPLTIGAVAMAIVILGVVWFKFAEEYLDTCEPVHFHSSQCTFPEFPGCFYCDQSVIGYKIALGFHYGCKVTAGFLAMLVVAKVLLATRVVIDEMSSPTTASPAGLMCMTTCVVFAGRGAIGQIMVSAAACGHLCLVIWFIYMALAYRIMPEPSWFPNTIGIGLTAVKTWLYYPMPGHLLMAISLLLNFFFFPISLIRVAANKKISATVGWMQMSAPAIALYSLTIMAQPSFEEEHPDVTNFQRVHRMVYLPCMHVMCALTILGMGASIHSLIIRWGDFSKRSFSPAHAAFAFPTLSHTNAIQAYRGAVMSFSGIPSRTWPFFLLDVYWLVVLIGGTAVTFWICGKFMYHLPEWTAPDLFDEEEPPAPYDTLLSRQDMVTVGDHLTQSFVSPAIIQANETGALIMARNRRDGTTRYVRTRRVGALGFEPTMNWSEMQEEAEALLEWVGKNPPRRRHRTLSVPGIDFNYGASQPFGTGNTGVYGTMSPNAQSHQRYMTLGANDTRILF